MNVDSMRDTLRTMVYLIEAQVDHTAPWRPELAETDPISAMKAARRLVKSGDFVTAKVSRGRRVIAVYKRVLSGKIVAAEVGPGLIEEEVAL